MRPTKAILCLWVGCSASATFVAFDIAYHLATGNVVDVVIINLGHELDLSGPDNFTINFPTIWADLGFVTSATLALVSLLVSWRRNQQPLFSWPHVLASFFLVPAGIALLFR